MKARLTERLEIRLTKQMKKSVVKLSKKLDVSEAEVMREGLSALEENEYPQRSYGVYHAD